MERALKEFLFYLEVEKCYSANTVEAYRLDLENGLVPFLQRLGKSSPGKISAQDIRDYLEFMKLKRGAGNAARARTLSAIKSFFNYLVDTGKLPASPVASIKGPKVSERKPDFLSEDECLRLLYMASEKAKWHVSERDTAIILLLLDTGITVSELTGLKTTDVDFEKGRMKIPRKGNSRHFFKLNGNAMRALERYVDARPHTGKTALFIGPGGDRLDRSSVYRLVRRYLEMAGIDKARNGPHLLRNTFCVRLHRRGIDPFLIKSLAGHKSIATTMRYSVNTHGKEA